MFKVTWVSLITAALLSILWLGLIVFNVNSDLKIVHFVRCPLIYETNLLMSATQSQALTLEANLFLGLIAQLELN